MKNKFYIPIIKDNKYTTKQVEVFHTWQILQTIGPPRLMCCLTNGIRLLHSHLMRNNKATQKELKIKINEIYKSNSTYFRTEHFFNDNEFKVNITRQEVRQFLTGHDLPIIYSHE